MTANRGQQRILAIKLADLGDLLLCEPAFRSLRVAFPSARIDVLTTPQSSDLVELIGHDLRPISFPKQLFDRPWSFVSPRSLWRAATLAIRLRATRYERVVVLHHLTTAFGARKFAGLVALAGSSIVAGLDNGRGTFFTHRVIDPGFGSLHESRYMRDVAIAAGGADVRPSPSITIAEERDLPVVLPAAYAVIFPVTGQYSRAREWSKDRFAQLAQRLHSGGLTPVVVGADDARLAARTILNIEPQAIDLTGRTSLGQLATILHGARLAIGGDTFIGHLAAAAGTPVVSIFGPSNSDAWRPAGSVDWRSSSPTGSSLVVRHQLPCEPCIYTGFRLGRPQGCPDRTCLKRVSIDDVDRAIQRVLGVA